MKHCCVLVSLLALAVAGVPAAHADVLTLGSDLRAPATVTEAHQADTAFWPVAIQGAAPNVPADGQVLSIKVKGMAIQPDGAGKPLNEFHFQTLDVAPDGTPTVYLSSQAFDLPYTGDPNQVNSFQPTNLCVHKGGLVDFNDEGGWDGKISGSLYPNGVPFRIFGAVSSSSTSWFAKDNGTKNGAVLAPASTLQGTELLLQYTLATGDDRSYECGGPLRDPSGKVIKNMQVTPNQDAYVTADGNFTIFGYCGDAYKDCSGGTATVTVNGKQVSSAPFSVQKQNNIKVPMKMSTADYALLAPSGKWTATVTLTTPNQGTVTGDIAMHTSGGGAMHVVKNQRVYVRGSRVLTPAGFCGVSTGCAGAATLLLKGKVVAKAKFVSRSRGKITITLKVPSRVYRQLRKKPLLAQLAITGPLGSDAQPILLRH